MGTEKNKLINGVLLLLYGCLVTIGLAHHELWGDELHSWNIAKGSDSFSQLIQNTRYEGHPPLWYICLFAITQFTHDLVWLKILQSIFVFATAWIILFKSPFTTLQKILILCGYYFVFEYAVLSRNYMPAVFFAGCIVSGDRLFKKFNPLYYYTLLFLLSSVHLLGLILGASLQASRYYEKIKSDKKSIADAAGFLVFLPALYFIFPPTDSQLNAAFWWERWNPGQFTVMVSAILKSLFPFPDVSNVHWWNSNLFLDNDSFIFRIISFVIFIILTSAMIYSVRMNRTALALLIVNLVLTGFLSLIFPLNSYRYVGFIFIGFLFAAWIAMKSYSPINLRLFHFLLLLQIPAAAFAFSTDYREKFSTAQEAVEFLKSGGIEPHAFVATDYWTLNNLAAYADNSFYTLEVGRKISFLQWNQEMKAALQFDYGSGLLRLYEQNNGHPFYFFSMKDPEQAARWSEKVTCTLVFFSGPSAERSGEIYLYRIENAR